MLTLQDTKLGLAEAALGEGNGTRLQKLSVKQIKDVRQPCSSLPVIHADQQQLFGMTRLNKDKDKDNRAASQSQQ